MLANEKRRRRLPETPNLITPPPAPKHLWASGENVSKIRRSLFLAWLKSSILMSILILLVALIYLGSGTNPSWHTRSLDVYVVDFDGNVAGTYFLSAFRQTPSGNQTLNWIFKQPSDFSSNVTDEIKHGRVWAVVYMNAGTSAGLNRTLDAILRGNASYSSYLSSSAVTIVYDEGRNVNTVNGYVLPPIRAAIAVASSLYAAYFQSQATVYSNQTKNTVVASVSLANISTTPISYTNLNLHPAFPYVRLLATSLGYLFLWLISLGLIAVAIRITQPLSGKVKLIDILVIRIINSIGNGLIVSLLFSLCILWLGDFTDAGRFVRFWLFNWLASITFSVIISLFTLNLGVIAQFALTIFIILNLSSSSSNVAIELQNRFYRIGYGLPLYHCFNGGRHLLFGSYTKFGLNIGVLVAYYVVGIILIMITGVYRARIRKKKILEKARSELLEKNKTKQTIKKLRTPPKKT